MHTFIAICVSTACVYHAENNIIGEVVKVMIQTNVNNYALINTVTMPLSQYQA